MDSATQYDAGTEIYLVNNPAADFNVAQARRPGARIERMAPVVAGDIPGGTLIHYDGVIVPENPEPGQITEDAFLDMLADLMARQLDTTPGAGEGHESQTQILRAILAKIFGLLAPSQRIESLLRAVLDLPQDLTVEVDVNQFLNGMLILLPAAQDIIDAVDLGTGINNVTNASDGNALKEVAQALFAAAGIMWFPPTGGNPQLFDWGQYTQRVGNAVHLLIQAHYWKDHKSDVIIFEDFLVAGPSRLATIWQAGKLSAPWEWLVALRAALMSVKSGKDTTAAASKRPDILNVTRSLLYEIKPKGREAEGIKQLANYQDRLLQIMPKLRLEGREPGDWRPFPLYWAGGMQMVAVEVFAPGLILYTRTKGLKYPLFFPLLKWKNQQEARNAARTATPVPAIASDVNMRWLWALVIPAVFLGGIIFGPTLLGSGGVVVGSSGAVGFTAGGAGSTSAVLLLKTQSGLTP